MFSDKYHVVESSSKPPTTHYKFYFFFREPVKLTLNANSVVPGDQVSHLLVVSLFHWYFQAIFYP